MNNCGHGRPGGIGCPHCLGFAVPMDGFTIIKPTWWVIESRNGPEDPWTPDFVFTYDERSDAIALTKEQDRLNNGPGEIRCVAAYGPTNRKAEED